MEKQASNISAVLDIIKKKENLPVYIDNLTLGKKISLEIHNSIFLTLEGGKDYHSLNMMSSNKPDILTDYILITRNELTGGLDVALEHRKKWIQALAQKKEESNNEVMYYAYIKFDDISHITTDTEAANKVKIFTKNGVFTKRETLKKLLEILPNDFVQVEKRDIVNLAYLVGLNPAKSIIFIKNMEMVKGIAVGQKYREKLDSKLKNGLIV